MYYYLVDEEPCLGQVFQRRVARPHRLSAFRSFQPQLSRPTFSWPADSFGLYSPFADLIGPVFSASSLLEDFEAFPRTASRALTFSFPSWSSYWPDGSEDGDESVAFWALSPSAASAFEQRQQKKRLRRQQKQQRQASSRLERLHAKLFAATEKALDEQNKEDQAVKAKKIKSDEQDGKHPSKGHVQVQYIRATYDPKKGWTVVEAQSKDSDAETATETSGQQTPQLDLSSDPATPPSTPVLSEEEPQPAAEATSETATATDDQAPKVLAEPEPEPEPVPVSEVEDASEPAPAEALQQSLPPSDDSTEPTPAELAAYALPSQASTSPHPSTQDGEYDFCDQEQTAAPSADTVQASGQATEDEEKDRIEAEENARSEQADEAALEGLFAQELSLLESIGFHDRTRSLSVLVHHFGSQGLAALTPTEKQLRLQTAITQMLQPKSSPGTASVL